MGEEQLCYHHGTISLDFIPRQVEVLEPSAFLEGLSKNLGTIALYAVPLDVEPKKSMGLRDQLCQIACTYITYFIITQVNVLYVDCIRF
jgi:hypothetical protein